MNPTAETQLPPEQVLAICLQILGIGFLLVDGLVLHYLWQRARAMPTWTGLRWTSISLILLLLGGASALFLVGLGPKFAPIALGLGCGLVLALGHPVAASAFLLAALAMRPWEIYPGTATLALIPKLAAGVSCFSWLFFALRTNQVVIRWDRGCILLSLLFLWIFLSIIAWGADADSLRSGFETLYPIAVLFFLITNSLQHRSDLMAIESVLGIVACAAALSGFYLTFATTGLGGTNRLQTQGVFGNSNDLGSLVIIGIAYLAAPFIARRGGLFLRSLSLLGVTIALLALMATQSRTVILALGAMGVAYTLSGSKVSVRRILTLALVGLVAIALAASIKREAADLEGSRASRFNYVIAGINMVKSYPFFGVGFGNYSRRYEEFTPAFVEWGDRTAHSSWVLVFSETGPIGLLLFGSLYLWSLVRTWKVRGAAPEMFLALVGYGVMMSFLSHTYLFPIYLLLALASIAPKLLRQDIAGS